MKKNLSLLLLLLFSTMSFSQIKQSSDVKHFSGFIRENITRNCIDTITDFFQGSTISLYAAPNGGFVSGNNGFNDSEKLQLYNHFQNYSIIGAWVWIGEKIFNSQNIESGIEVVVVHTDSTSSNFPPFIKGPSDSVLATAFYPMSAIVASEFPWFGLNYIEFASPVLIRDGYALGVRFTSLAEGDTLGIITSADGEPNQARRSWERWDGVYGSILDNWGLNIDLAIFPIVDCELNNISNLRDWKFIPAFPNPVGNQLNFAVNTAGTCSIKLLDLTGREVLKQQCETLSGIVSIDVSKLNSGTYFAYIEHGSKHYYSRFEKYIR